MFISGCGLLICLAFVWLTVKRFFSCIIALVDARASEIADALCTTVDWFFTYCVWHLGMGGVHRALCPCK